MLTSIDREGTAKGFDTDLTKSVSKSVPVPVIASGGMGNTDHLRDVITKGDADAVAMAHVLHYHLLSLTDIRTDASDLGINQRRRYSEWMN